MLVVQKQKQKRGNSNKFDILIKHMSITDRGNEVSSDSRPDRGRDTMMPVTGGLRACVCVLETVQASCVACAKTNKTKSGEIATNSS